MKRRGGAETDSSFASESKRQLSSYADQLATVAQELLQQSFLLRELIDQQERVSGMEREAWLVCREEKDPSTSDNLTPSSSSSHFNSVPSETASLIRRFLHDNIKRRVLLVPAVRTSQEQLQKELEAKRRTLLQLRDSFLCS